MRHRSDHIVSAFRLRLRAVVLFFCAVLLSASPTVARQKATLAWQWETGDSYTLNLSHDFKQRMMFGGQANEIPCKFDLKLSWSVESVADDGTAEIRQSIQRLEMGMKVPNIGEIKFDSDAPPEETTEMSSQIQAFSDALNEQDVYLQINPNGEIIDERFAAPAESIDESVGSNKLLTSKMITNLIKFVLPILPDAENQELAVWTHNWDCETPTGQLIVDASYRQVDREQENDRPLEKCTQELTLEYVNAIGSETNVKIVRQVNSGTILVDAQVGMIVESKIDHEIFLEIPIAGGKVEQQLTGTLLLQIAPLESDGL